MLQYVIPKWYFNDCKNCIDDGYRSCTIDFVERASGSNTQVASGNSDPAIASIGIYSAKPGMAVIGKNIAMYIHEKMIMFLYLNIRLTSRIYHI